jgi:phosphate transport system substrate-binding protein
LVLLVMVGLGTAALAIVSALERGPAPPFLVRPPPAGGSTGVEREPGLLRVAGSGGNLPVTRALAEEFTAAHPDVRVVVHASIGSTGGVRAAYDRAVDIGLVSRELSVSERDLGLRVVPYAKVAVVFAANPSVPIDDVTGEDVLELYGGRREQWPDGTPVVVLQRERGDSSHLAVAQAIAGFADVDAEAVAAGRWRVLYRDSAMHEALMSTRGALGIIDLSAVVSERLVLRTLAFEGVRPSATTVAEGRYRLTKPLAFLLADDAAEPVEQFVDFAFSPVGQQIIAEHGCVAVPREESP